MPEITFVGGPHDGLVLHSGLGVAPFLFTDGKRCYRAPRVREAALYMRMAASSVGGKIQAYRFHFAGHTHTLCKCGVFRRSRDECRMCGAG